MSQQPVVEATDVVAGYLPGVNILNGCNLVAYPGEMIGIIGPNGAGKSTLLKAMFGLVKVHSGQVTLNGDDITNLKANRLVEMGVGFVPQTNNVFVSLSVEENLEMGAYVRKDDYRPRLAEIYEMFPPLAEKRRQPAGSLSGGQRQMVAMGKALMLEPAILLLDEPTAGLSPKYRGEIFQTVKTINAAGTPILMVEQNAKQALRIADTGHVLVNGANFTSGTGADLLADEAVRRSFLGGGA